MEERHEGVDLERLQALAATLAARLVPGDVVALHGSLGAGKTTFVQGLARGLGIRRPVTSPTFTVVTEHRAPGGLLLVHMDLYRLRQPDDLQAIGFQEYLDGGAVLAIEWPERAGDLLPSACWHVELAFAQAPDRRELVVRPPARPDGSR